MARLARRLGIVMLSLASGCSAPFSTSPAPDGGPALASTTADPCDDCPAPKVCDAQRGCLECAPGKPACFGDAVYACTAAGERGSLLRNCDPDTTCREGRCLDACGLAELTKSYLGCEYWPVDLDNAIQVLGQAYGGDCADYAESTAVPLTAEVCFGGLFGVQGLCDPGGSCTGVAGAKCQSMNVCALDAQHAPFAVVVANPDAKHAVNVTLADAAGTKRTVTVAPGAVASLFPQELGFVDRSLDGSAVTSSAYRLTSTRPIVAYQFNPLDNVGVFSNDASLLLPTHALGTRYLAVAQPSVAGRPDSQDLNGYVTIIATAVGPTKVTVKATAAVRAGPGVSAFGPGTQSFLLERFQTLNLEAAAKGDLTGTEILSDQPVAVHVGHEAVALGQGQGPHCYADHIEHQLFPTSTWGQTYAVARSQRRRDEPDLLRIVAQRPNTKVVFAPPTVGPCTLGPGAHCDVYVDGDVEIRATEPVLVAHHLLSAGRCDWFDLKPPGDPALALSVPTEQFRRDYTFLVPAQYAESYAAVVAPASATVRLDGVDVTAKLAPFGSGAFKAARLPVTAGAHRLECPQRCGVEVMGYGETVSYMFAGGLDLKPIAID